MTTKDILRRINKAENGCWLWTGARFNHGYGKIVEDKKYKLAHRIVYERFVGGILPCVQVLHSCDTPLCVNPRHLFLGTVQANMKDRDEKGRQWDRRGARNGRAQLTDAQVKAIRESYRPVRGSVALLARLYGMGWTTIKEIVMGQAWIEDAK